MAIYHMTAKVMKRSEGKNAVHAAAYRSGGALRDERSGQTFDYSRRKGVEHSEILAPDGAPDWVFDRAELWNRVEASEKRKDAQIAREVEFALPRELSAAQCVELACAFVREEFVSRGMVADISIHRTTAGDGGDHPHCHVMLTMRHLGSDGFGQKTREWNDHERYNLTRERWAKTANDALDAIGSVSRIDHRSYAEQGIAKEPEPYLGIALKVRDLTLGIREKFNQWVAVRHRNRARDYVAALEAQEPNAIEERMGAFLSRTARSLGLDRLYAALVPERETREAGFER